MAGAVFVLRRQLREYLLDRGMILFQLAAVLAVGILLPLLVKGELVLLSSAALIPMMLVRQWAAESFAGEREQGTLETLLSSPISSGQLYLGKCGFCFLTSSAYLAAVLLLMTVTRLIAGASVGLGVTAWMWILFSMVIGLGVVTMAGVVLSLNSTDLQTAGSRINKVFFTVYLVQLILISVFDQKETLAGGVLASAFWLLSAVVGICIFRRIKRLTRSDFLLTDRKGRE